MEKNISQTEPDLDNRESPSKQLLPSIYQDEPEQIKAEEEESKKPSPQRKKSKPKKVRKKKPKSFFEEEPAKKKRMKPPLPMEARKPMKMEDLLALTAPKKKVFNSNLLKTPTQRSTPLLPNVHSSTQIGNSTPETMSMTNTGQSFYRSTPKSLTQSQNFGNNNAQNSPFSQNSQVSRTIFSKLKDRKQSEDSTSKLNNSNNNPRFITGFKGVRKNSESDQNLTGGRNDSQRSSGMRFGRNQNRNSIDVMRDNNLANQNNLRDTKKWNIGSRTKASYQYQSQSLFEPEQFQLGQTRITKSKKKANARYSMDKSIASDAIKRPDSSQEESTPIQSLQELDEERKKLPPTRNLKENYWHDYRRTRKEKPKNDDEEEPEEEKELDLTPEIIESKILDPEIDTIKEEESIRKGEQDSSIQGSSSPGNSSSQDKSRIRSPGFVKGKTEDNEEDPILLPINESIEKLKGYQATQSEPKKVSPGKKSDSGLLTLADFKVKPNLINRRFPHGNRKFRKSNLDLSTLVKRDDSPEMIEKRHGTSPLLKSPSPENNELTSPLSVKSLKINRKKNGMPEGDSPDKDEQKLKLRNGKGAKELIKLLKVKKDKREIDHIVFNGDISTFFKLNENNQLVRDAKTPPALKNARNKRFNLNLLHEFRKDKSPMIVSFFDEHDTRVIQPRFMEYIGSMCTTELMSNSTKKEYQFRMRDQGNAKIQKSLAHEGGDGLYKPEKIKKKADIMKAQKDLENKDDLVRQKLEEQYLRFLMSAVENTKGIDKLLDKEKLKNRKKSPDDKSRTSEKKSPLAKFKKQSEKSQGNRSSRSQNASPLKIEDQSQPDFNKTTENLINFVKSTEQDNQEDLVNILRSPKHQLSKFSTSASPAGQSLFSQAFVQAQAD